MAQKHQKFTISNQKQSTCHKLYLCAKTHAQKT